MTFQCLAKAFRRAESRVAWKRDDDDDEDFESPADSEVAEITASTRTIAPPASSGVVPSAIISAVKDLKVESNTTFTSTAQFINAFNHLLKLENK